MRKKKELYRGLTAMFSFFLIIAVFGTTMAVDNAITVNGFLGVNSTVKIIDTGEESEDTLYYKTGADSDDVYDIDTLDALEKSVADENIAEEEEGAVLLRNENNALPLEEGSNVTLLGASTVNYNYSSKGAWSDSLYRDWTEKYEGYSASSTIVEAMERTFHVNTALINAYTENTAVYPGNGIYKDGEETKEGEAPASFYTSDLTDTFSSYGDAAIISFSRDAGEGNDVSMTGGIDGSSVLALQPNEKELLSMVQTYKENGIFRKVIVLLNTNNAMEIGELDDYGVDAVLWIGNLGTQGANGVVNILAGKVSPSGHLVDTYAANSLSSPAAMNANDNTQYYDNADEILEYCEYTEADYSGEQNFTSYIVEAEGIYVGYKYYETRYEDCILGQGNAASKAGVYAGKDVWNYNDEVVYPFGHGISYTTFEQKLDAVTYDSDSDTYKVTVTVTNTGDTYPGKSVVQVYAQTPYGDYEKENKIEKSAVQLVGFAKTDTLEPGESQTVTVEAERYFLASYDVQGAQGYILSAGDYYFSVGDDAHDALNNILAAKGAHGMTDIYGNETSGNKEKTYHWTQNEIDTQSYAYSRMNDSVKVTNQFDDADLNYWFEDTVTYLSRSDWEGTYPVTYSGISATDEMMELIKGKYEQPEDAPSVDEFESGVDHGITFAMMKDVDYDDEETWNKFLDQFTTEEMLTLAADVQGTPAIESVGIPETKRVDDGTSIGTFGFLATENGMAQCWVSEMVTASTFNPERFQGRGKLLGAEACFVGLNELWYGGGNIHRTPFGGRNGQYYSEDGILGYIVGKYEAEAMQSVGVNYCIKHFAGNDQETNRESLGTFFGEQAFREIYLKALEGAICEGKTYSVMGGFNRIGCVYSNYSFPLMTTVLRDEWDFEGHLTTDAVAGSLYKTNWALSMTAGTDYYCGNGLIALMGGTGDDVVAGITKAVENGDGYVLQALRRSAKNNVNSYLHTNAVNGLSENSKIVISTPWWQYALYVVIGLFAVLTIAAFGCYIYRMSKEKRGN